MSLFLTPAERRRRAIGRWSVTVLLVCLAVGAVVALTRYVFGGAL